MRTQYCIHLVGLNITPGTNYDNCIAKEFTITEFWTEPDGTGQQVDRLGFFSAMITYHPAWQWGIYPIHQSKFPYLFFFYLSLTPHLLKIYPRR